MAQDTKTVAWFNNSRGFGFLTPTSGPDVFVQCSAIQAEGYKGFKEGDKVKFDILTGASGEAQACLAQVVAAINLQA